MPGAKEGECEQEVLPQATWMSYQSHPSTSILISSILRCHCGNVSYVYMLTLVACWGQNSGHLLSFCLEFHDFGFVFPFG